MDEITIQETMDWAQDPLATCGGSPVIQATAFEQLAIDLATYTDEVSKTSDEILAILKEQSKRFAGCGGNFSDKWAVIRRNPGNARGKQPATASNPQGWQYILDLIA
jgi:hypothetical protein